jgi:hypothetical protein
MALIKNVKSCESTSYGIESLYYATSLSLKLFLPLGVCYIAYTFIKNQIKFN